MKIKIFTFKANEFGSSSSSSAKVKGTIKNIYTIETENTINNFIKDKEIIDIKVTTYEPRYHNNGGINQIMMQYTILYK